MSVTCKKCGFVFYSQGELDAHGKTPMPPGTVVMPKASSWLPTDLLQVVEEKGCKIRVRYIVSDALQRGLWGKEGVDLLLPGTRKNLLKMATQQRDGYASVLKALEGTA